MPKLFWDLTRACDIRVYRAGSQLKISGDQLVRLVFLSSFIPLNPASQLYFKPLGLDVRDGSQRMLPLLVRINQRQMDRPEYWSN